MCDQLGKSCQNLVGEELGLILLLHDSNRDLACFPIAQYSFVRYFISYQLTDY